MFHAYSREASVHLPAISCSHICSRPAGCACEVGGGLDRVPPPQDSSVMDESSLKLLVRVLENSPAVTGQVELRKHRPLLLMARV